MALDSHTGKIVWKRKANGSIIRGGAITKVGNHAYWFIGMGYSSFNTGLAADGVRDNFYAYKMKGKVLKIAKGDDPKKKPDAKPRKPVKKKEVKKKPAKKKNDKKKNVKKKNGKKKNDKKKNGGKKKGGKKKGGKKRY